MMRIDQVTDSELSILQFLWEHGKAINPEITLAMYGEATEAKSSSVQKLIERLEAKGCIGRDRSQRTHRFRASISREQYLRGRLQVLADRVCDAGRGKLEKKDRVECPAGV